MKKLLGVIGMCAVLATPAATAVEPTWPQKTHYRYADVLGQKIFYREAGEWNSQTIVLLHGYPSSSHAYRELIPLLSGRYHVIAPDDLGSGLSSKPSAETFEYNFDVLAKYTDGLLKVLNIRHFILYMQDFGAPVGFRIMMMNPDRIQAIIAQNANAYLEGIPPEKQAFFNAAQMNQSPENWISLAPYQQRGELVLPQKYLPLRVCIKIGLVILEEFDLNSSFRFTGQEVTVIYPRIRAHHFWVLLYVPKVLLVFYRFRTCVCK